jgi:hypothetical protein
MIMNLDELHSVEDLSKATLLALSDRIARSTSEEQFIYRECEIDELWRLLGPAHAPSDNVALRAAVMEVHDLVGVDGDPKRAAERLRELAG